MISVENLTISSSERTILDHLDLNINPGARIGIVGPSGVGKSTLAFALLGSLRPGLRVTSGQIIYRGEKLLKDGSFRASKALRHLRMSTGHLDQDPASSLNPAHRIGFILNELLPPGDHDGQQRIMETLSYFGLPTDTAFLRRFPAEISGGQRRRIALARILLRRPSFLILDEPTADLDRQTRDEVVALLRDLLQKIKPALLIISHDREVVEALTDQCFSFYKGGLVPLPGDRSIFTSAPLSKMRENRSTYLLFRVKNLCASAPGLAHATIQDVSFDLYQGEALAITGRSGSGKTTLLRTLLGLWPSISGTLSLRGETLAPSFEKRLRSQVDALGWIPQDPSTSFNPAVLLRRALCRGGITEEALCKTLSLVGVPINVLDRYPDQVSGGQIQRLAIARALLSGAHMLLLDEATSSLDPESRNAICSILCSLKAHCSLIVVTHDPMVVDYVCDRTYTIKTLGKMTTGELTPCQVCKKDVENKVESILIKS